jgi:phage terminase Nu1 subunit (DNA packaging protein)
LLLLLESQITLTKDTEPDFDDRHLFNKRMTARLVGISVQALSNWEVQPVEYRGTEALYYWPHVRDEFLKRRLDEELRQTLARIAELEASLIELRGAEPAQGDTLDLDAERARLAAEQADKIAMENAIARGEVAYLPDVAAEEGRIFEMIRAKSLALPTKCAAEANPENPNVARDVIERHVLELLGEIAAAELRTEQAERRADVPGPSRDPAPAAEAHRNGMGGHPASAEPRKQRRTRPVED